MTYMARDSLDSVDLRYHLSRWADRFVVESLDALEAAWGLKVDRDLYRYAWTAEHRVRAAETTHPRLRRVLGKERFRRWVVARLESAVVSEQLALRGAMTPSVPRELPRADATRVIEGLPVPADDAVAAH